MANAQCFPQPNQTVIVRQSAKPVAFTLLWFCERCNVLF